MRTIQLAVFGIFLALPSVLSALPAQRTASDTVDDATIELRIFSQTISGDANSWCELRVQDAGTDVALTENDTLFLWVYEDDSPAGKDEIWKMQYVVTAADVAAGSIDKTFDCSSDFGTDGFGSNLEIFAEGRFEKDKCGTFCILDRPKTSNIDSAVVEDDSNEEDDDSTLAKMAVEGRTTDRIARDDDWYQIVLTAPSAVTFAALQFPPAGTASVAIFDLGLSEIAAGVAMADRNEATASQLGAGTYYARVQLDDPNDYVFYDVQLAIDDLDTDCIPGETESRDCAMCGTETRTCDSMGAWGAWGGCEGQGQCEPGASTTETCGNCGQIVTTCSDTCQWVAGTACEGEGECPAGAVEQRMCAGGTEERVCSDACAWGAFGACEQSPLGDACQTAATCGEFVCVSGGGIFRGGYCGTAACASDAECGPTGVCMTTFGERYCLKTCTSDTECRPEYRCASEGTKRGCAPRCASDADCGGATCDAATGICSGTAGGNNGGGTIDEPDMGGDGGTDPSVSSEAGCGCASVPGSEGSLWLLVGALVFARLRRRQR